MRYVESFKDNFIRHFSQKKWDDFEDLVIKLVKDSLSYTFSKEKTSVFECEAYNKVTCHASNPEYAQVIGVMQGVCYYGLGYKDLGAINIETTPRYWLEQIEHHLGIEEYKMRKDKGLLPIPKKKKP